MVPDCATDDPENLQAEISLFLAIFITLIIDIWAKCEKPVKAW